MDQKISFKSAWCYTVFVIFSAIFSPSAADAVPAYDGLFNLEQSSDVSFEARQRGDEWYNWVETKDGYGIYKNATTGNWEYYVPFTDISEANGNSPLTGGTSHLVVGEVDPSSIDIPKGLRPPKTSANEPHFSPLESLQKGLEGGSKSMAVSGTMHLLVIGVDYADAPATYTAGQIQQLLFGNSNSVSDYYNKTSYSSVTIVPAVESYGTSNDGFIGWLRLSGNHPNTGGNTDSRNQQIAKDAILATDPYINYAQYDANGNGIIEPAELSIMIIVAGYEAASTISQPSVWGHQWDMYSVGYPSVDGKAIQLYAQFGEKHGDHLATLGIMAHELGHLMFALPDLYDTDKSNGDSAGVGYFDLIGSGSWGASSGAYGGSSPTQLSAWSKEYLSWGTVNTISSSQFVSFLKTDGNNSSIFRINTFDPYQYFLVENRQFTGYDIGFQRLTGVSGHGGLVIYHIDSSKFSNADENDKMVDVEEANEGSLGYSMLDNNDSRADTDMFFFSGNNNTFTDTTIPGSRLKNNTSTNISITNISAYGDTMSAIVSFTTETPLVSSFSINNGASSTTSRTVTLNNTATGNPTQYMASESSTFSGATWKTYSTAPSFTLSAGNSTKTVYFKVRNASNMESSVVSDTIILSLSTNTQMAFYTFDEGSGTVAGDSSGNGNHGAINGATWTTGKSGGALSFDGNDSVQISGLLGQPKNVTISAWANLNFSDVSGAEVLTLGNHVMLRLDGSEGRGATGGFYDGTTWLATNSGIMYAGTGWHHFVYVMDDTNNIQKIYVDGVEQGSTAYAPSISYAGLGSNTFIGKHGNPSGMATANYDFNGKIDEVQVYSKALSAQEVLDLYNQSSGGLVSRWKLDEGSGTTANDSVDGNHGTINGATWTTGKIGGALSFDGNDSVQIPGLLGQPKNVTISAWANLNFSDVSGAEVLTLGNHVMLRLDGSGGRGATGGFYDGTTWLATNSGIMYAGTGWHHFVYVMDDTNNIQKIYVDGVEQGSTAYAPPISYAGLGSNTFIGKHGNPSGMATANYDFNGKIDEVQVYSKALSAQEVLDLYNQFSGGLISRWKLDEGSGTVANDSVDGNHGTINGATWTTGKIGGALSFDENDYVEISGLLGKPRSITISLWVYFPLSYRGEPTLFSLGDVVMIGIHDTHGSLDIVGNFYDGFQYPNTAGYVSTGKWNHIVYVIDDPNDSSIPGQKMYVDGVEQGSTAYTESISYTGNESATKISGGGYSEIIMDDIRVYNRALSAQEVLDLYNQSSGGLVSRWKLDEGSGTTANDSVDGNHGTINGATWTTGKSGGALSFDGNDSVQIPGLLGQPKNVTISAWANLNFSDVSGAEVLTLGNHVMLRLDGSEGRGATGGFYDGTTWLATNSGIMYAGTGWHHFVYVMDDTNNIQKIYVDGVEQGSTAYAPSISYAGLGSNTFIGKHGNPSGMATANYDFNGKIDEVRVYNRALSASEVLALYNYPNSSTEDSPPLSSTGIILKSFHTEADHDGRVTLHWETSDETDTAGFNLYRSRHKRGRYTKVNNVLINTRDTDQSDARYSFADEPDHSRVYYYKLEHVDYYGKSTPFGPLKVRLKSQGNE